MQSSAYQFASPLRVAVNARWAERILLWTLLVGADILMILLGFWVAYLVRFESNIALFYQHQVDLENFYLIYLLFLPVDCIFAGANLGWYFFHIRLIQFPESIWWNAGIHAGI